LKKKLKTGKSLSKYLDNLVRKIFKLKYGTNPHCFVCGRFDGWFSSKTCPNGIQVGHYISRRWNILRWDLKNVFPQCSGCNRVHNQNPAPFTLAIIAKYGKKRIEYLQDKVKQGRGSKVPVSRIRKIQADLEEIIKSLTNGS